MAFHNLNFLVWATSLCTHQFETLGVVYVFLRQGATPHSTVVAYHIFRFRRGLRPSAPFCTALSQFSLGATYALCFMCTDSRSSVVVHRTRFTRMYGCSPFNRGPMSILFYVTLSVVWHVLLAAITVRVTQLWLSLDGTIVPQRAVRFGRSAKRTWQSTTTLTQVVFNNGPFQKSSNRLYS